MTDINAKWIVEAIDRNTKAIEALVEAQKPRLVHLEAFDDGEGFLVNPTYVVDVSWRKWKDGGCVGVVTDSCDHDRDEHFRVKGTLAEVMDKLRGDK